MVVLAIYNTTNGYPFVLYMEAKMLLQNLWRVTNSIYVSQALPKEKYEVYPKF